MELYSPFSRRNLIADKVIKGKIHVCGVTTIETEMRHVLKVKQHTRSLGKQLLSFHLLYQRKRVGSTILVLTSPSPIQQIPISDPYCLCAHYCPLETNPPKRHACLQMTVWYSLVYNWICIGFTYAKWSVALHTAETVLTSDWSENSFVEIVYEKIFFSRALDRKFWLNFFS